MIRGRLGLGVVVTLLLPAAHARDQLGARGRGRVVTSGRRAGRGGVVTSGRRGGGGGGGGGGGCGGGGGAACARLEAMALAAAAGEVDGRLLRPAAVEARVTRVRVG